VETRSPPANMESRADASTGTAGAAATADTSTITLESGTTTMGTATAATVAPTGGWRYDTTTLMKTPSMSVGARVDGRAFMDAVWGTVWPALPRIVDLMVLKGTNRDGEPHHPQQRATIKALPTPPNRPRPYGESNP